MPRLARVVAPGVPHHITQRGNDRCDVFNSDADRLFYLETLRRMCRQYGLDVHGYCLMANHVHLIAVPLTRTAMAKAVGQAHWIYSQYFNDMYGRCGHLWHSRFYSCSMDGDHRVAGLRYVECNPERAGLVRLPWEYVWSSAAAHCGREDPNGLLNLDQWFLEWTSEAWRAMLVGDLGGTIVDSIRERTSSGRPLGSDRFVAELEVKLGRQLRARPVGRPRKNR